MSLNKKFLNRPTNITAKIIKDSVSEQGKRMTTYELEYPRYIHAEILTHRTLSKNCSSSRAIPIEKMIEFTDKNMAMPVYWGKKRSGMQATVEVDDQSVHTIWLEAYYSAVQYLKALDSVLLHKQIANRIIEPYTMMKVVLSGTDFDNFWNLRLHKDAQPEFVLLVDKMYSAMQDSTPTLLRAGQWHLPYVDTIETDDNKGLAFGANDNKQYYFIPNGSGELTLEDATRFSVASCASVSYRTESLSLGKADIIYDMLVKAEVVHSSPLEHQGTPIQPHSWTAGSFEEWDKGVTHIRRNGDLCSGNMTGFIQYRHLVDNNTCEDFDYEERMKTFN